MQITLFSFFELYTHVHPHTHTRIHACTHTLCVHTYVRVCVCVCVHVCVFEEFFILIFLQFTLGAHFQFNHSQLKLSLCVNYNTQKKIVMIEKFVQSTFL